MASGGTTAVKNPTGKNRNSNVTVISQVLLKSANMSSRKDFLSNVLQTSSKNIDFVAALPNKMQKKQNMNALNSDKKDENNDEENMDSSSSRSITPERIVKKVRRKSGDQEERKPNIQKKIKVQTKEVISSSDSDSDEGKSTTNVQTSKTKSLARLSDTDEQNDSSSSEDSLDYALNKSSTRKRKSDNDSNNNKEQNTIEITDNTLQKSNKLLDDFAINNECKTLQNVDYTQLNSLNKDQEIYFLEMPKDFDPNSLLNIQLPFDKSTNLKSKKGVYNWSIDLDKKPNLNLINFEKLITLNTVGTIMLGKHFETYNANVKLGSIDDIPPYPENITKRHPLFGNKYRKKIELPNDISEKLNNPTQHVSKKRKRKSITNEEESENVDNFEIFNLLDEHERQNKAIRNKNDLASKKKKKEVKNKYVFLNDEIEEKVDPLILQIFENDTKTEYTAADFQKSLSKHKKKSKSKKRSLEEDLENASQENISIDVEIKHKSKKKKKEEQIRIVNSTMLPSPCKIAETVFDFDESAIPKVKKNKRKHRSGSFELDHLIDDIVKDVNLTDGIVKHKKHKRKNKDKLLTTV